MAGHFGDEDDDLW